MFSFKTIITKKNFNKKVNQVRLGLEIFQLSRKYFLNYNIYSQIKSTSDFLGRTEKNAHKN